jgi:hypothetical protein
MEVNEGVPGFMTALYLYKKQFQSFKSMIYQRFWEEVVTKLSRSVQLIPQVLRDTFVRHCQESIFGHSSVL